MVRSAIPLPPAPAAARCRARGCLGQVLYATAAAVPHRPHLVAGSWIEAADPAEAGWCWPHLRAYRQARAAALARLAEAPQQRERWWDQEATG